MTAVNGFRRILHNARAIAGTLGLRPYRVYVLHGSWSGTYPGEGAETETSTEITESGGQPPKVRFLNDEELQLAGGVPRGPVNIGPITPDHGSGGTALSTLIPAVTAGQTVYLKLVGPQFPDGVKYVITEVGTDRALHYTIRAQPNSAA